MTSKTNNSRIEETFSTVSVSLRAPTPWRMLLCALMILAVPALDGCVGGDSQGSLEARVAELAAEKQRLSDELKNLQSQNAVLNRELTAVKRELSDLTVHADKVRQLNSALMNDTQALRAAVEKLKTEHERLLIENIQLKKELADRSRPTTAAAGPRKEPRISPQKAPWASQDAETTPCEAIIQLLQRSEAIARNYKGDEQRQRLRTLRAQFEELIKKAPSGAADAVNAWLRDLSRLSFDPLDAAMFPLLVQKNAVLKACIKSD